MQTSTTVKNILASLAKAQAKMGAVGKSGENKFDRYNYAKLEDYVGVVQPVLAEFKLSVVSSVTKVERMDGRTTNKGDVWWPVQVELTVRVSDDTGEWIEAVAYGEGIDRGDKGIYKAITGARKYGLAAIFNLATTDDPETDSPESSKPAAKQAERPSPPAAPKPDPSLPSRPSKQAAPNPQASTPAEPPAAANPNPDAWVPSEQLFKAAAAAGMDPKAWTKIALNFAAQRAKMTEQQQKDAWAWIVRGAKAKGLAWDKEAKVFAIEADEIPMEDAKPEAQPEEII